MDEKPDVDTSKRAEEIQKPHKHVKTRIEKFNYTKPKAISIRKRWYFNQ